MNGEHETAMETLTHLPTKVRVATSEPFVGGKSIPRGLLGIVFIAALLLGFYLYLPALSGPFVFDDFTLPYQRTIAEESLSTWITIAGVRPFLIFTYWVNRKLSGESPVGYHVLNLFIHVVNTVLVFLVLYRLLQLAGWVNAKRTAAAVAGAAVFLVHPLQTESVSYIAGRSESLAALFVMLAYLVFLYRRHECISWRESVLVLVLLGVGMTTKENAIGMAGVFILTDVFWPTPFSLRGVRNNWRLYLLILPGAIAAAAVVLKMLVSSSSAGFSGPVRWYQYGFTQARAIFTYLRLSLIPFDQSIDHDYPISHTVWEYGAGFYLLRAVGAGRFLHCQEAPLPARLLRPADDVDLAGSHVVDRAYQRSAGGAANVPATDRGDPHRLRILPTAALRVTHRLHGRGRNAGCVRGALLSTQPVVGAPPLELWEGGRYAIDLQGSPLHESGGPIDSGTPLQRGHSLSPARGPGIPE